MVVTRYCSDIHVTLESLLRDDYRLDMIAPADAPRTALLSRNGESIRLLSENIETSNQVTGDWKAGRAGMMYCDLIPDRLGGKLIASHIRITVGGPVPDYVHYHKVRFQMIYCLRGRIRVVYEDQGPPFWLEPGDCVLQPPEIRHRVLEAEANSEVIEVTSPAEHETWIDHEMELPTSSFNPDRDFSGQKFIRYSAVDRQWKLSDGCPDERDTGISSSTKGRGDVRRFRMTAGQYDDYGILLGQDPALIYFSLYGNMQIEFMSGQTISLDEGSCIVLTSKEYLRSRAVSDCEYLRIDLDFS